MILIGRFLSPYVRRVATTMNFYGMKFESRPMQHTGDEMPQLRKISPIGRVPALVISDDEFIIESSAIIDYLDREAGAGKALTPASGTERTRAMNMLGVATGSIDKNISVSYEVRFRPEEMRHAPWVERCEEQVRLGYQWLESQLQDDYFLGKQMSQVDITTAVGWQFLGRAVPALQSSVDAPKIEALVERLMQRKEFSSTLPE